jgi:hypothetical protein
VRSDLADVVERKHVDAEPAEVLVNAIAEGTRGEQRALCALVVQKRQVRLLDAVGLLVGEDRWVRRQAEQDDGVRLERSHRSCCASISALPSGS